MKIENVNQLTAEDLAAVDPAFWAVSSCIKLQVGNFTFEGREYLDEPMRTDFPRLVFMKGTQGGASLVVILKILHGLIYGRYPRGVLYLMPTIEDIREFSQSKFGPLFSDNISVLGKYLMAGKKGVDSTTLKQIGNSFLFLRPATLSRKVDVGYDESSRLKAISVDAVAFDELDTFEDQTVVQKALGRMGASKAKDEFYIGNPGTPNRGIDAQFLESDQRHYWIRCQKCTAETCAEKQFFENANFIKVRDDGSSYLGCKECGNQIFVKDGYWKPDVPSKSDRYHGYRWSQLILPDTNLYQLLQDFRYPPQGNLGDVMRTKLGMPFIAADDVLTQGQVFACCDQNREMRDSHPGPCAMGVDVGDVKHIVIGGRVDSPRGTGEEHFEIFKAIRLEKWDDIHALATRFNVRSAVIDADPFRDSARQFQRREKYRVWLCTYNETTVTAVQYNPKTKLVKVNRTEIFDQTGRMIRERQVVLPRKHSPSMEEFAKQVTDPVCIEEENKRGGGIIRRYRGRKDHYRNALNYFRLAADGGKIGIASTGAGQRLRRDTYARNDRAGSRENNMRQALATMNRRVG